MTFSLTEVCESRKIINVLEQLESKFAYKFLKVSNLNNSSSPCNSFSRFFDKQKSLDGGMHSSNLNDSAKSFSAAVAFAVKTTA